MSLERVALSLRFTCPANHQSFRPLIVWLLPLWSICVVVLVVLCSGLRIHALVPLPDLFFPCEWTCRLRSLGCKSRIACLSATRAVSRVTLPERDDCQSTYLYPCLGIFCCFWPVRVPVLRRSSTCSKNLVTGALRVLWWPPCSCTYLCAAVLPTHSFPTHRTEVHSLPAL